MRLRSSRPLQRRAAGITVAALLTLVQVPASAQLPTSERARLTELERAVHLLNRATYGARPRDLEELLSLGAAAWLERQLNPEKIWSPAKRPFDFVASALRMTGGDLDLREFNLQQQRIGIVRHLETLEHVPYMEPAPTGFANTSDEWISAGAMVTRMNTALELASGTVAGVRLDPWRALQGDSAEVLRPVPVDQSNRAEISARLSAAVLQSLFPGRTTTRLAALITEDLTARADADLNALVTRAVALALGSPEFQRY